MSTQPNRLLYRSRSNGLINIIVSLSTIFFGISLFFVPPIIMFGGTIRSSLDTLIFRTPKWYAASIVLYAVIYLVLCTINKFEKHNRISIRVFPVLVHFLFITIRLLWFWETDTLLFYASITAILFALVRHIELYIIE